MHGAFAASLAYSPSKDIKGAISAIAAVPSKQLLILGTSTGYLYTVDISSHKPALLQSLGISKRPLDQLLPIASLDLLLILTDGNVHSFSIATLKERDALPTPPKANLLAVYNSHDDEDHCSHQINSADSNAKADVSQDNPKGDVLLTVASRRTLWIGRWEEGGWVGAREVALPHQIRSITFTKPPLSNVPIPNLPLQRLCIFLGFSTSEFGIVSVHGPDTPVLSPLFTAPLSSLTSTQIQSDITSNVPISSSASTITSTTLDSHALIGLRHGLVGLGGLVRLGPSKVAKNSVIGISDSEVVIIRDNYAVFLNSDGRPSRPKWIEYPDSPDETVVKGPFIISLIATSQNSYLKQPHAEDEEANKNGNKQNVQSFLGPCLYVHSLATLQLVQIISLPSLRSNILFPGMDNSTMEGLISRLDFRATHLSTPRRSDHEPIFVTITPIKKTTTAWGNTEQNVTQSIVKLDLIPGDEQFEEMISNGDCLEAIALIDNPGLMTFTNPDYKRTKARSIYAVQLMYKERDFDSAVDAFIDLETNPAKVVSLYPEVLSGRLYVNPDKRENIFSEQKIADAKRLSLELDDEQINGNTKILEAGCESTREKTTKSESEQQPNDELLSPTNNSNSDHNGSHEADTSNGNLHKDGTSGEDLNKDTVNDTPNMESKSVKVETIDDEFLNNSILFRQMVDALIRYLTDRRQKVLKAISTFSSKKIPISFDLIPRLSPEELRAFPDIPINTLTDVTHTLVLAQVIDTALFRSYLAAKPSMLGPLCRLENWCEVEEVEELLLNSKKYRELLDLYNGKRYHEKALKLLQKTSDDEDDLEMKVQPTISYLQKLGPGNLNLIFDGSKWIHSVYPEMVLQVFVADHEQVEALPRHAVALHLEKLDIVICAKFLEHNIHILNEESPEFHEKLIEIYLHLAAHSNIGAENDKQESEKSSYSRKLLQFLENSQQYRADRLIAKSWTNDMPDVRAILLGRLGQHEGALQIYVNRLENYFKAEDYCKRVYKSQKEEGSEVFFMLVRIYLKPKPHNTKPQLDKALDLLSRHAAKIDISRVLDLLPSDISMSRLSEFLIRSIRSNVEERRYIKVEKEILLARLSDLDLRLVDLHGQRIKLEETRTCAHCHKRLGNSVLAIHPPNGEPTHYNCRLPYIESRSKIK